MLPIAVNSEFTILDETEDYLALNKPAPLQVHPSKPSDAKTLWHGLKDLLAYELINGGQISIINRLDRETSGVVLVAKNRTAARHFGIAMQEKRFEKTYLAIAYGWPKWDNYDLSAPILRQGEVRESRIWVKQCVHPAGAACFTRFRVLRRVTHPKIGALSLIEAAPITGRMHQIRVHLAHLQHPILGDKIYGQNEQCYLDFMESGWTPSLADQLSLRRHALHCRRMVCPDVPLGKGAWEAPLPLDMNLIHWET